MDEVDAAELGFHEVQARRAVEAASRVPESFEQAVSWACNSTLQAANDGLLRQTLTFTTGESERGMSGDISEVFSFVEQLGKTVALQLLRAADPEDEDGEESAPGIVSIVFNDMGTAALAKNRYKETVDNLVLDYLPPMIKGQQPSPAAAEQLARIASSSYLIFVTATQAELQAVLDLDKQLVEAAKDTPMVFVNPKLLTNKGLAAGIQMKRYMKFAGQLVETFHLEQLDPPDDGEMSDCNPGVLSRAYPKLFACWEDNPDDPEAVDGYFLTYLSGDPIDSEKAWDSLMQSRWIAKKVLETRVKGPARVA